MATETVSLRLDPDIIERIDRLAARATEQSPVLATVKRADVLRGLVLRGLDAAEHEIAGTAKRAARPKRKGAAR